ncbi:CTD nuclear envelope phosphatase 1 [Galdieria sulphuraria]|nr:CTD nuclear envelope phosphatase 1 [Galdieria sulphuraria]
MNSYKQRQSKTESVGAHISVAPAERTSTDKSKLSVLGHTALQFLFLHWWRRKSRENSHITTAGKRSARDVTSPVLFFVNIRVIYKILLPFTLFLPIVSLLLGLLRELLSSALNSIFQGFRLVLFSHNHLRANFLSCIFYVNKRPYLDVFLRVVSQWYDLVVYTASLQKYADPLIDALDVHGVIRERYFRDHCIQVGNNFIKDISIIEPDLRKIVIVDNSPSAYVLHEENAIPIGTWPYVRPFAPFNLKLLNRSFIHFFLLETIVNNFTWLCSDKNVAMISKFIFFGWSVKCMNNSLGVISKPTTSDWPS